MKLFIYVLAFIATINLCLASMLPQKSTKSNPRKSVSKKAPKNNGKLNEDDHKKIDLLFKKYGGANGKLTEFQFNQTFHALGIKNLSPGAFKSADLDKDGTVDKNEFLKYYAFLKKTGVRALRNF